MYMKRDLFGRKSPGNYSGDNLKEIAFPLGGIGTGSISLGGWAQLRDWEIMNRPAKGFVPGNSFFTLKVLKKNGESVTKVIQGPPLTDFNFGGHSAAKDMGEGLPCFRKVSFIGQFPFATVKLEDRDMPVDVTLEAFNPFIPLNNKDSSIPVAVFLYQLKNLSRETVRVKLFGNLTNIIGHPDKEGRINTVKRSGNLTGLYLATNKYKRTSPEFGSMVLSTNFKARVWRRWPQTGGLTKFWEAVTSSEDFPPEEGNKPKSDTGTIGVGCTIKPGETCTIPFILAWYFPVFEHWQKSCNCADAACGHAHTWKNYYATVFSDAWDVATYTFRNLKKLYRETKLFHDALFSSTLPDYVLDAVSSQISILKTPTCLRLEDGTFYGFEGCSDTSGCCEGSCSHVWNYAQALPYLFPSLQRSMREANYNNNMQKDGFLTFRLPLPLGTKANPEFHPAADGQMGGIMQVYREWQISGDDEWLRKMWPKTKKALEFAWKYWDRDKDGVMEGMQHNTYDIEFYGPNTMMGSLYLGALRAGEEIARYLGEIDKANEYHALFEKGSAWAERNLFNGQYYEQRVAPHAEKFWPEKYRKLAKKHGRDDKFDWPKWQFGKGCLSDQMIGQWYAAMLDLGYLYETKRVKKTLQSVFRYNWRGNFWDHPGLLRLYAMNDEQGLLVCTWPKGGRPGYAFHYADEVWCGIEYQVASHMIYEGLLEEGLSIVRGVRLRHNGVKRNPWDEFECGHHYSRSMASYALLLALSGFSYSAPERRIGFAPKLFKENFRVFFSVASGWGIFSEEEKNGRTKLSIEIDYGVLRLKQFVIRANAGKKHKVRAFLSGKSISSKAIEKNGALTIIFKRELAIRRGRILSLSLKDSPL